jgi:hypothetical protein
MNKNAIPMPKNRKRLQNSFPNTHKEIADYLKQKDFSLR